MAVRDTGLVRIRPVAWGMFGSLPFYAVLVELVSPPGMVLEEPLASALPLGLGALSLSLFGIVPWLKRTLLRVAAPESGLGQRFLSATVVGLALAELPALLGLVLYLLGGGKPAFYVLLAMATLLFVVHFPRRAENGLRTTASP